MACLTDRMLLIVYCLWCRGAISQAIKLAYFGSTTHPLSGRYVPAGNTGTIAATGTTPRTDSTGFPSAPSKFTDTSGQLAILNRHYRGTSAGSSFVQGVSCHYVKPPSLYGIILLIPVWGRLVKCQALVSFCSMYRF